MQARAYSSLSRCRAGWSAAGLALALAACGSSGQAAPGSAAGGGVVPAADGGATHPSLGLVSVVPAADRLRVEWRAVNLGASSPAAALFVGPDPATLLTTTPQPIGTADEVATVTGLAADTEWFCVLAFDDGSGGWEASGPTLRARTAAPVHARPGADGAIADGLTPQTAWPTPGQAIQHAANLGGGNVWLAGGTFGGVELSVPAGVNLYGGFGSDLSLAGRDAEATPTRLVGDGSSVVVTLVKAPLDVAVIDGLSIDGAGAGEACLEVDERWCELRRVAVGSGQRGFKLRSLDLDDPIDVTFVRCAASACAVGGVSIDGAFDVLMEDCSLSGNGQEGLSCDDLVALEGEVSRLELRDCKFIDNGSEGVDVDLVTSGQPGAGRWVILIEDCEFVGNAGDGCLIDCDYEGNVGWTARIELRGCVARGNSQAGFHLDIDASASSVLHRVRASANRGDGLWVSSESARGTVSAMLSVFTGNQGYGVRTSLGNVGVLVSHCVLSGNFLGGLQAEAAPGLVTSSVAYLQGNPWGAGEGNSNVVTSQVTPLPFQQAPRAWQRVMAYSNGSATLGAAAALGAGSVIELNDDSVTRSATTVAGQVITIDPAPSGLSAPAVLSWFDAAPTIENWRPSASSPALGAGMALQGGPALDAGPFGPAGSGTPGRESLMPAELFRLADTDPSWTGSIGASAPVVLLFEGGPLDSASAPAGVDAVDSAGNPVAIGVATAGSVILVSPPGGGWTSGTRLQLHQNLRSTDGRALVCPIAVPLTIAP